MRIALHTAIVTKSETIKVLYQVLGWSFRSSTKDIFYFLLSFSREADVENGRGGVTSEQYRNCVIVSLHDA